MSDRPRTADLAGEASPVPGRPAPGLRAPRPTRLTPAIGALLVVVAVTSLIDDADILSVRWWIPFAAAAVLAALAVVALTVRRLLAPETGPGTRPGSP